jgi:hypothetical protein
MLHIGIADFAEPALLLLGDADSLAWLADQIEAEQDIDFASLANVVRQLNFNLRILFTERGGGLSRREAAFVWEVSPAEARRIAAQLHSLAENMSPSHAYLDPTPNLAGVQVIASLAEYDPGKIFQV